MAKLLKPSKPKLSPLHQKSLEEGNYDLQIEITIKASCDNQDLHRIAHHVMGEINVKLWQLDSDEDEDEVINIGYISGWRTVSSSKKAIELWADRIGQEIYNAFAWLLHQKHFGLEEAIYNPVLFIEEINISPEWRGRGFAFPSVASFLNLLACRFVFFHPAPPGCSSLPKQQQKRAIERLRNYWERLGFEDYDRRHNIMWSTDWQCPNWLQDNQ